MGQKLTVWEIACDTVLEYVARPLKEPDTHAVGVADAEAEEQGDIVEVAVGHNVAVAVEVTVPVVVEIAVAVAIDDAVVVAVAEDVAVEVVDAVVIEEAVEEADVVAVVVAVAVAVEEEEEKVTTRTLFDAPSDTYRPPALVVATPCGLLNFALVPMPCARSNPEPARVATTPELSVPAPMATWRSVKSVPESVSVTYSVVPALLSAIPVGPAKEADAPVPSVPPLVAIPARVTTAPVEMVTRRT